MSKVLDSGMAAGRHLHTAISLAPPALCEVWSASNTVEEFDFLAPQRRMRRFAAIGGTVLVLGALGLVGMLGRSNDASNLDASASASAGEPETQLTSPASSPTSLVATPEAAPHYTAGKPTARMATKAKRGARRR